ncbi:helix-turn-helix transcriptional regulator [Maritimibacter sp. DP1N21-5]|uniref:helix-turn-helix transcriptional regulator n=1 Tax=Maritimibacter sp. DP1N21-5 TaxID=2836867 RepID=UPI001C4942BC|nr:helix-turn-helix transcriptional regulator [Maritimibacter sp. DP1N21-5]MBV7408184.1 helix-turn-helix transcriptional regulator [Maritimibacter sp. DP1N21-5]
MLTEFFKRSGMTRTAMAEALGIGRAYLSLLENGRKRPSLELAFAIERATNGEVPASSWIEDAA